jgi:3-carboxy-cis,cis-muconate cycloisomerase
MTEAVVADFERSTGPWEIEWITLPQIVSMFFNCAGCDVLMKIQCTLSHACLEQTRYLLEGLEVDEAGMKKNLESTKGAVVSEAVMMGLGKTIGRQGTSGLTLQEMCVVTDDE